MKSVDENQVLCAMGRSHSSKCSFETCRLSKFKGPYIVPDVFLGKYIQINQAQKKDFKKYMFLFNYVEEIFIIRRNTTYHLLPFSPNNKQLTTNQFIM